MNRKTKVSLVVALNALLFNTAHAITVTPTVEADELANTIILPNSGITITSSYIHGGVNELDVNRAGKFTNDSGVYGLPNQGGIVLSTGNVTHYADGENPTNEWEGMYENSTSYNDAATNFQNEQLQNLSGFSEHYDPIELGFTFDVTEDVTTLSFIATFGSEEYPNFVGSEFIDAFGMFVNGENIAGALPTGASDGDPLLPININHPDMTEIPGTQLNAVIAPNGIPLVRFDVPVEPGSTGNTFELLLADTSDDALDSTIYLSSFGNFDADNGQSEFTPILTDPSNPTNEEGDFVFDLPEVQEGETIWIDPDIAVGYIYSSEDGLFASITAPSLATVADTDGYTITYLLASGATVVDTLFAGESYTFTEAVESFTINDINPSLMLDPNDVQAFALGVSFNEKGQYSVTQSPITEYVETSVPEPHTFAFMLLTLGALCRRRN